MIRARGDKFEVRVYAGYEGTRRRMVTRTVATKKEARALEKVLAVEVLEGKHAEKTAPKPKAKTVADALDRYLVKAKLGDPYEVGRRIDTTIRPHLGPIPLKDLKADRIDEWTEQLKKTGRVDGGPLSGTSVLRMFSILRAALELAVRYEWLDKNPCLKATKPIKDRVKIIAATPDEVKQLMEQAEPDFRLFLRLAIVTGARRGELCAVRRSSISHGALSITGAITRPKGGKRLGPTKNEKERRIALDARTLELIDEHLWNQETIAEAMDVDLDPDPYLFAPDPACSEFLYPSTITHRFSKLRDECKLPHVILKNFRHASLTLLIAEGTPTAAVAQRGGHTVPVLEGRYIQSMPIVDQAAADYLGGLFA